MDSDGAGAAVEQQQEEEERQELATIVGPSGEILLLDESTSLLYEEDGEEPHLFGYYNALRGECVKLGEGMDELIGARLPERIDAMPGFKEKLVNEHNLLTFARTGMVIIDGVVPPELVAAVRDELAEATKAGDLELEAPANNQGIRQDKVLYLPFFEPQQAGSTMMMEDDEGDDEEAEDAEQQPTAVDVAAALLESVGAELNEAFHGSNGASAAEGGAVLPTLLRPEMFMLAEYDAGAGYKPHRDSVPTDEVDADAADAGTDDTDDDDDDDGVDDGGNDGGGGGGSGKADAWCNPRVCTAILYLNRWVPSAGGQLRCFAGADSTDDAGSTCRRPRDVPPIGGRIIIFKSQELLHAVLPSFKPRKAMTVWFVAADHV